jgi:hypothetical protein
LPLGQTPDSQAPNNWRASLKAAGRPDVVHRWPSRAAAASAARNDSPQKSEASAP